MTAQQAGTRLPCTCGQTVEVPTLRGLRSLPVLEEAAAPRKPTWTLIRGVCFNLAVITMLLGLFFVSTSWLRLRPLNLEKPEVRLQPILDQVDQLTPLQAWEEWSKVREMKLADRPPPMYLLARTYARSLRSYLVVGGIMAALGGVGMIWVLSARRSDRPNAP